MRLVSGMSRQGGRFQWPFIDVVVVICTINIGSEGEVYL